MWTQAPQTPGPSADGTDMSHGEIARVLWRLEAGQQRLDRRMRRMEIIAGVVVGLGATAGTTLGGLIGG